MTTGLVTDRKEEKPSSRLKDVGEAEKAVGEKGYQAPAHSSSSQAYREESLPCIPARGPGILAKFSHTGSVPAPCIPCGRCLQGQKTKWVKRVRHSPKRKGKVRRRGVPVAKGISSPPHTSAKSLQSEGSTYSGVCVGGAVSPFSEALAPQEDDLIGGAHL